MYDHEKKVITAITTGTPGWMRPATHPCFVVLHAATMPMRDQELWDREHDVGRA